MQLECDMLWVCLFLLDSWDIYWSFSWCSVVNVQTLTPNVSHFVLHFISTVWCDSRPLPLSPTFPTLTSLQLYFPPASPSLLFITFSLPPLLPCLSWVVSLVLRAPPLPPMGYYSVQTVSEVVASPQWWRISLWEELYTDICLGIFGEVQFEKLSMINLCILGL